MKLVIHDRMIESRLNTIRERIQAACKKSGRDEEEVEILAVTKQVPVERIQAAMGCGLTMFGENYVQELIDKFSEIKETHPEIRTHFIGHLQTNKVKRCMRVCSMIQTLDSIHLAENIQKYAETPIRALVQIRLDTRPEKTGHPFDRLDILMNELAKMDKIKVCGLMGIPPASEKPEDARPYYRKLYREFLKIRRSPLVDKSFTTLSMGMSHDFEIAVEEGSTLVRVGRALFGERMPEEEKKK